MSSSRDKLLAYHKKKYLEDKDERIKYAKEQRKRNRELALKNGCKREGVGEKNCTTCKLTLQVSKFGFNKSSNNYTPSCKSCMMLKAREYRIRCKTQVNERDRKRLVENLKKPEFKITRIHRGRMSKVISRKSQSSRKYIGCSIEMLLKWFDFNFQLDSQWDMSWDNHGAGWHVDHCIPCAKFDALDDEHQKICFHWSNWRPLPSAINVRKGDKLSTNRMLEQELRLRMFIKENPDLVDSLQVWQRGVSITAGSRKLELQHLV
jgi:hypothetical protein